MQAAVITASGTSRTSTPCDLNVFLCQVRGGRALAGKQQELRLDAEGGVLRVATSALEHASHITVSRYPTPRLKFSIQIKQALLPRDSHSASRMPMDSSHCSSTHLVQYCYGLAFVLLAYTHAHKAGIHGECFPRYLPDLTRDATVQGR